MSATTVSSNTLAHPDHLPRRMAVVVFLAFALAYFFSALVRAITRRTWVCWLVGTFWAFRSPSCPWVAGWTSTGPKKSSWLF